MGETKIDYDEKFGMNTFKREICNVKGEKFWEARTENLNLPDIEMESSCQCRNMFAFMRRFEAAAGQEAVQKILYRVRHGLHPSQSAWAREEFLKIGDLDRLFEIHQKAELENFIRMNREGKGFYGQEITDEVLDFIRQNPAMLAPVRKGNIPALIIRSCCMNKHSIFLFSVSHSYPPYILCDLGGILNDQKDYGPCCRAGARNNKRSGLCGE